MVHSLLLHVRISKILQSQNPERSQTPKQSAVQKKPTFNFCEDKYHCGEKLPFEARKETTEKQLNMFLCLVPPPPAQLGGDGAQVQNDRGHSTRRQVQTQRRQGNEKEATELTVCFFT